MITVANLYSAVFRGAPDQIGQVRGAVREYLDGCPRSDDAVLIVSELVANAIRYSASKGHFFRVRCEAFPSYAWVEVEDLGGPWHPRQRDGRPHGLDIITALVGDAWGTETTSDGYRITWAQVDFHG